MNVPQRKPRDKEKVRQQYLANLQLENSNNTLNLNASKMYKATGASAQVASTITGAEKLAGLEGLKQIAKDHLVSFRFCNPLSAGEAVDALLPEDVAFVNEYAQFIGADFKGRNVPGKVIVNYIKKLRKKLSETEGVDYGIQQNSGSGILLTGQGDIYSQADIEEVMRDMSGRFPEPVMNQAFKLMNSMNRQARGIDLERAKREGPDRYDLTLKANSAFRENAPTVEQLLGLIELDDGVGVISALQGAGKLSDYLATVGAEASSGPVFASAPTGDGDSGVEGTVGPTPEELNQQKQAVLRQRMVEFEDLPIENKRQVLLLVGVDSSQFRDERGMRDAYFHAMVNKLASQMTARPFEGENTPEAGSQGAMTASRSPSVADALSPANAVQSVQAGLSPASALSALSPASDMTGSPFVPPAKKDIRDLCQDLEEKIKQYIQRGEQSDPASLDPGNVSAEIYDAIDEFYAYVVRNYTNEIPNAEFIVGRGGILETSGLLNQRLNEQIYDYIYAVFQEVQALQPSPSQPSGVTTAESSPFATPSSVTTAPMRQPRPVQGQAPVSTGNEPKGKGIKGGGISRRVESYEKPKPYRQFGRHLIHRHKLEDGILMLKYPSGARIKELPTQKVGEDLTRVLKEMSDGRMPQYHHFQGLGIKDKELLHSIVRHTQFQNLEVPPPDKDAMDKELNRFDILRGEIEAGNDNRELIKEFKVMLLKFMRQGRIPKTQVKEIMEELLMMGH
jgi:hypothetical protein